MNICKKILIFIAALSFINFAKGDVPVYEDSGTDLMKWTQKVQQYSDKNETADEQRMKMDIERNKWEKAVDDTAKKMGAVNTLLEYIQKLLEAQGSSLDIKNKGDWEKGVKGSLKLVQLNAEYKGVLSKVIAESKDDKPPAPGSEQDPNSSGDGSSDSGDSSSSDSSAQDDKSLDYDSMDGRLLVEKVITIPPKWMDTPKKQESQDSSSSDGSSSDTNTSFYSPRTQKLLVKVAAHIKKKLQKEMRSQRLEFLAYGMARDFFPDKMLKSFNASKTVSYLLGKAGVVEAGEGVIIRPAVAQDAAFVKYV